MTTREGYQQLLLQLYDIYDNREAANIADWVIEHITGQRKTDRVSYTDMRMDAEQQEKLSRITHQLLAHVPVQYALNESWFAGMKLYVNEEVLIPRPETEELVEWVVGELRGHLYKAKKVLDIGTGSGCIPVALKKKIPELNIRAIDVSEGALNIAIKNAMLQAVQVYFMRIDFLDEHHWKDFGRFDIIVSNPPYVRLSEACAMQANVLEYEPHLALFVPDEDALLFYRKIAAFGKDHLEDRGAIFLEINEALGAEVSALLRGEGYEVELKKDLQGKDRMIRAIKKL